MMSGMTDVERAEAMVRMSFGPGHRIRYSPDGSLLAVCSAHRVEITGARRATLEFDDARPVEQDGIAGGLVAVEQELPDTCGAAAAREVVPVSGIEPDGQAAVPQGLQAGAGGVLPPWLRVDLVQREHRPKPVW
jgi:hypothetical protein